MKRFDKLERMCEAFDSYQYDTTGTMKNEDALQDAFGHHGGREPQEREIPQQTEDREV